MKKINALSYRELTRIMGGTEAQGCSVTNFCNGNGSVSCSCTEGGSCDSTPTGVECKCNGQNPQIRSCTS